MPLDFNRIDTAATGFVSHCHTHIKSIETANFGKIYSKVVDSLNYYLVDSVAKPILQKAPEWVYDNRAVNAVLNNKGISIVVAAVVSFVLFVIWLHPEGETPRTEGKGEAKRGTTGEGDKVEGDPDTTAKPLVLNEKDDTQANQTAQTNSSSRDINNSNGTGGSAEGHDKILETTLVEYSKAEAEKGGTDPSTTGVEKENKSPISSTATTTTTPAPSSTTTNTDASATTDAPATPNGATGNPNNQQTTQ